MDWWHQRKWLRSVTCTRGEFAILRAFLSHEDPRCNRLLLQATDAPEIHRQLMDDHAYVLTIPYVKDTAYAIDVKGEVTSPQLRATDMLSGRDLVFTVKVLCGGSLNELVGACVDGGPWPLDWDVDADALPNVASWIPTMMIPNRRRALLESLAEWCETDDDLSAYSEELLYVDESATSEQLDQCESRLGVALPDEYREFVRICNGVSIRYGRPYEILGTDSVYTIESRGFQYLVVTYLYEEGVAAIDLSRDPVEAAVFLPQLNRPETIGSFREHVLDSLAWLADRGV